MRQRIQTSTTDQLGLLFYGAAHGNLDAQGFAAVKLEVPLEVPDAATIIRLEQYTLEDYQREVGSRATAASSSSSALAGPGTADDLKFGLWAARDQFTSKNIKARRRLLLFSNCQDPTAGDPATAHKRESILSRARELAAAGVSLDFFPLCAAMGQPFDLAPFWAGLMAEVAERTEEEGEEGQEEGEEEEDLDAAAQQLKLQRALGRLSELVTRRANRKRPTASTRLELGPGVEVAVQLFNLVQPAKKRSAVSVTAESFEPVQSTAARMCMGTGTLLTAPVTTKAFQPKTKQRFPQVLLSTSEVESLKGVRPRGLTLLGFKPASALAPWHQVSHSLFVYPHEKAGPGSTAAFVALQHCCLEQGVVAVVRYVSRTGVPPVLGVLLPQEELVDEDNVQVVPPGMHLLILPFKDDLRFLEGAPGLLGATPLPPPRATAEQVSAVEALVGALTLEEFDCAAIHNPTIAWQNTVIEAVALNKPIPEEVPDDTQLDLAAQQAQHGEVLTAFLTALYGPGGPPEQKAVGSKRKEAPVLTDEEAYHGEDWAKAAESVTLLNKMTMDKLKVYLKYHRLPLSGKKADLVERVRSHVLAL